MDGLIGLETAKAAVRQLARPDSGVHAVLFYGQPGSGTTSLALAVAQAWMCPKATDEGPCGACGVCKALPEGRAVDLQHIHPWGPQSLLKLSAIREKREDSDPFTGTPIRTFFRTRPLMARHKVVILEHAHRLGSDAANALLKTLEEPPPGAKLILTTSELGRVLPTIRSRCLPLACELPAWEGGSMFAETPGQAAALEACREEYEAIRQRLDASQLRPHQALALSRDLRACADAISKKADIGARQAQAETARCVAQWLRQRPGATPAMVQSAVQAYRLLLGNASAAFTFDSLFCSLCFETGEPIA
jgi:hypothetical protein